MFHTLKYSLVCIAHVSFVAGILKLFNLVSPCFLQCLFSSIVNLIVCLFIARYTFIFAKRRFLNQKISPHQKAVLITGCASGFGHHLAKRLDSRGFKVFATCLTLNRKGAEDLRDKCSERLKVLEMNVTKDESVEKAFQFVKDSLGDSVLWAIVNNAGIQKGFTADLASLQDFKDTMEVNGFGMVRVTKKFLPLLKQSRGRIVNVTSFAGRLSTPHNAPYIMSKFAATGFNDSLRMEMFQWGIRVVTVEPELFQTKMTDINEVKKRFESEAFSIDRTLADEYGEDYFEKVKAISEYIMQQWPSSKIDTVVDALEDAVSAEYPNISYRPSRNELFGVLTTLGELLPHAVIDMIAKVLFLYLSLPKPKAAKQRCH